MEKVHFYHFIYNETTSTKLIQLDYAYRFRYIIIIRIRIININGITLFSSLVNTCTRSLGLLCDDDVVVVVV